MNDTVTSFYSKGASEGYGDDYDRQHGFRFDALVRRFGLGDLKGHRVLDVGGGRGFLGKRLDPSNEYWVVDGADVQERLCLGMWAKVDLDHDDFGSHPSVSGQFDVGFCLETLEHLGNPHHCLVEMKRLLKIGAPVYISVPDETVWHNTPYCGLLWPKENFAQFLGQMALPIREFWHFQPGRGEGWPAYTFKCENRPWSEKRLAFPKEEAKFRDCTPLEATNL